MGLMTYEFKCKTYTGWYAFWFLVYVKMSCQKWWKPFLIVILADLDGKDEDEDPYFIDVVECLEAVQNYVTQNTYVYTPDTEKVKEFLTNLLPPKNCHEILVLDERGNELTDQEKEQVQIYLDTIKDNVVRPWTVGVNKFYLNKSKNYQLSHWCI